MCYHGGMRKKIFVLLGVMIVALVGLACLGPANAYAANFEPGDGCTKGFLGFRPWYQGLP